MVDLRISDPVIYQIAPITFHYSKALYYLCKLLPIRNIQTQIDNQIKFIERNYISQNNE